MSYDIENIRRQFPILERQVNGHPICYLDNAATTFSPQIVLEKAMEYETTYRANVSRGVHSLASEATDAYEAARESVAKFINAGSADEVIFTSGATASINHLAFSLESNTGEGDEILVSLVEHHSNLVPWQRLCERTGATLKVIPIDAEAGLDLSRIDGLVTERTRIVALAHASNVTGDYSDIETIAAAAKQKGATVVVDGAQAVPHGPVDVQALDADFYVFSGHKCYGPTGIGVLWGKPERLAQLSPFMVGGGMVERVSSSTTKFSTTSSRFEAGTPPIAQAIGLGAAVEWLMQLPWHSIKEHEAQLLGQLSQGLSSLPGTRTFGSELKKTRLPIVSFEIEGCHPHDICHVLDQYGVAVRGGHHCAQPLMDALNVVATTRASFAVFNGQNDVDRLVSALHQAVEILS